MLAALDWSAILIALFVVIGISVAGGLIFGFGMSADALRGIKNRDRLSEDELDRQMEDGLSETLHKGGTQIQLIALSAVAAAIGGVIVTLRADNDPLLQAGVVGAVIALLEFMPGGDVPLRYRIASAIVSPVATLAAAYAML